MVNFIADRFRFSISEPCLKFHLLLEGKDAAILQLLPLAIKATEKKVKSAPKRKRTDATEKDKENIKEASDKNFDEFILRVNVSCIIFYLFIYLKLF